MTPLRNMIFIALAIDATQEEITNAYDIMDRVFAGGGVDPQFLINQTVPGQVNGTTATGMVVNDTASTNGELDAAGLPWDERIHSSNKKKNDKGLWWAKRGVTPAFKSQIEAQLRATIVSAPATSTPPSAPPSLPVATTPPLPGAGLPPVPGSTATTPDPAYTAFVKLIAENTQSPSNPNARLTDEWVKQVLTHYGIAEGSIQNLAHALDKLPEIDGYVRSVL